MSRAGVAVGTWLAESDARLSSERFGNDPTRSNLSTLAHKNL